MKTQTHTFAAGESINLGAGNFLQYMRGEGPLDIRFYHGRSEMRDERADEARPGYATEPPRRVPNDGMGDAIGFTSVVITSPTAQTVQIGISYGRGAYNRFTGDVEITSPLHPDGSLDVGNREDKLQRAPLTTLAGATAYNAFASSVTAVSAANNANGAVLRHAFTAAYMEGGAGDADVSVGGIYLIRSWSDDNNNENTGPLNVRDIYVPAGTEITLSATGQSTATAWVEVL